MLADGDDVAVRVGGERQLCRSAATLLGLWEADDKPFAVHLELRSHRVEHARTDGGAEVLEVGAKRDGANAVRHGPNRHGRAVDGERDLIERAVAADAFGERGE